MTAEWQEGIVNLWPTAFIQRRLPDHQGPTGELLALVRKMESGNRDLTTDYLEFDLFNREHGGVDWLRTHINQTTIDYFPLSRHRLSHRLDHPRLGQHQPLRRLP